MKPKLLLWCLAAFLVAGGGGLALHAAHDRHEKDHSRNKDHGGYGHDRPGAAASTPDTAGTAAYAEACGSCHMAYPPQLLPAASWRKIATGDHFGADLPLDDAHKQDILAWLQANGLESGSGKLARKARKHLQGQQPGRITEIAYLQRKHRKIDDAVFQRPGVGSFANCKACHPGAEQGDFEDDHVRIPGQ